MGVPSSSLCTTSSRRSSMPPSKELHFFVGKPDGLTRRENLNQKKKGKKFLSYPKTRATGTLRGAKKSQAFVNRSLSGRFFFLFYLCPSSLLVLFQECIHIPM